MTIILTAWSWLAGSRLGRTVAAVAAVFAVIVGALVMARLSGRRAAEAEQQQREHEEYVNARERMDKADVQSGGPDADAEWLREYQRRRGEG